jgi:cyclic pyranopterin phosphate synthase
MKHLSHEAIMRYEEIAQVVAEAARQGIRRVRLTGGEPLVRPDLPELVRMIAAIPGIDDISLTTNGVLLEKMAPVLKDAGLKRVNISLDSLIPEKFARITRGGSLETTLRGIDAAERVGLNPIKINAVAMRGVNDDELVDLARLTIERGWEVRFIELMPVSNQAPWGDGFPNPTSAFLSITEIKAILAPLELEAVQENGTDGPAREFRIKGASKAGRIGFISPLSDHFCQTCNRLRITSEGHFRPCLLHDEEIDFLPALRGGAPVSPYLRQAVEAKPGGHELELEEHHNLSGKSMRQIGG